MLLVFVRPRYLRPVASSSSLLRPRFFVLASSSSLLRPRFFVLASSSLPRRPRPFSILHPRSFILVPRSSFLCSPFSSSISPRSVLWRSSSFVSVSYWLSQRVSLKFLFFDVPAGIPSSSTPRPRFVILNSALVAPFHLVSAFRSLLSLVLIQLLLISCALSSTRCISVSRGLS